MTPLVMETSDHVPCLISVKTDIPVSRIFRFENYLMEHEHFMDIVQHGWNLPTPHSDKAKLISAKFKNLRRVIKAWQSHLSSLKSNIANVKLILVFLNISGDSEAYLKRSYIIFTICRESTGSKGALLNGLKMVMLVPSSFMLMLLSDIEKT